MAEINFEPEGYLSFNDNNFYIYGEISNSLVNKIIIPFRNEVKEQLKKNEPIINIYINSPGGEAYITFEFLMEIEKAKKEGVVINTYALSLVASAASLIAVCGTNRYVSKVSSNLVHYPIVGSIVDSVAQNTNANKEYEFIARTVREHYNKYCNIPDLEDKLNEGNYTIFGGKNLKKLGLADYII